MKGPAVSISRAEMIQADHEATFPDAMIRGR
jgi:hypothetical protein